jgi:hypothetical protein
MKGIYVILHKCILHMNLQCGMTQISCTALKKFSSLYFRYLLCLLIYNNLKKTIKSFKKIVKFIFLFAFIFIHYCY